MSYFQRPKSLAEVASHILQGADAGMEVKDFLHELLDGSSPKMIEEKPARLDGSIENGLMLDAYLQALAVYLSVKLDTDPPAWTHPPIQLPSPWFASPGAAIRNYLLISSPAPFRTRNLFIDEDSLTVV